MKDDKKNIEEVLKDAERIGVIGSPSSTSKLTLDILGSAVNKKLVGELGLFSYTQEGSKNYAMGQITEVELHNIWHQDPTIRSLIRQKGSINPVSERQDTHIGQMTISAVFQSAGDSIFEPSILGTIPATGTPINIVSDDILNTILSAYKDEIFYLGNVYGSKPKLPMWFKHFDSGKGGAGEAYHLGIFGKTGSGKSVLAKMTIMGYARHKQMGIFILDPQGEFSKGLKDGVTSDTMKTILCKETLEKMEREYVVYDLNNIALSRWSLFAQFLIEFNFFFELGIKSSDYQKIVAEDIEDFCRSNSALKLSQLDNNALAKVLEHLDANIHRVYAGKQSDGANRVKEYIAECLEAIKNNTDNRLVNIWTKVGKLFDNSGGKKNPKDIVNEAIKGGTSTRKLVSIDLSQKPSDISPYVWDEKIKPLIIDNFLSDLVQAAEYAYRDDKSLNTLVVIDEAHRLAPRGSLENEKKEKIRSTLVDAVRTTRKYGLGWLFISQTLSSLDKDIIEQLRINFFGFGLSMGTEFQSLRELAGGDPAALKLYQSFRDPHSAFDNNLREYAFMSLGPVSPLSFAGTPLFLSVFTSPEVFLKENNL